MSEVRKYNNAETECLDGLWVMASDYDSEREEHIETLRQFSAERIEHHEARAKLAAVEERLALLELVLEAAWWIALESPWGDTPNDRLELVERTGGRNESRQMARLILAVRAAGVTK